MPPLVSLGPISTSITGTRYQTSDVQDWSSSKSGGPRCRPWNVIDKAACHAPLLDDFFAWPSSIATGSPALVGCSLCIWLRDSSEGCLAPVLDEWSFAYDHNASERALRSIATAENPGLFIGSDDHATLPPTSSP